MDAPHGKIESRSLFHAPYVPDRSSLTGQTQNSAPSLASKNSAIRKIRQRVATALSAALNSFSTSIGVKKIAPVRVEQKAERAKTYNLTLDLDNVYYANGILVANCADAFCMTFCHTAEHRGKDSYEPAYYAD